MKWEVSTGGKTRIVEADSVEEAGLAAVKGRGFRKMGLITEIKPRKNATDDNTYYLNSVRLLEKAGFEVKGSGLA